MNIEVLELIRLYQTAAAEAVGALVRTFSVKDPLVAWQSGNLPQIGRLPDGMNFRFHGGGCMFKGSNLSVDVDFGPEGRCDGFDAWRLFRFAKENLNGVDFEHLGLRRILDDLASNELLIYPQWPPNPHLYFVTERGYQTMNRLGQRENDCRLERVFKLYFVVPVGVT